MDNVMNLFFVIFFAFLGFLFGNQYGERIDRTAIDECQKELPRSVNCKIIAVPVDKN